MSKIILLYRLQSPDRKSIENVFKPLERLGFVHRKELPCDLKSPSDVFRLFWFAFSVKEKNIHITGDVHYMAFFLFWKKTILTIHDCNHYEILGGMKKWLMGFLWYRLPMKFANAITVISPFTKNQLDAHFKIAGAKTHVIPNSFIPVEKRKVVKDATGFTILTIGSLELKNQLRLAKAILNIPNARLCLVGRINAELKRFLELNQIDFVQHFNIQRKELEECYNSSDLLFFASTREGFGLPILEAQSCGLPVLTSDRSSMPFVAGNGAHLVDPYNIEEIRKSIIKIMNDNTYRVELIQKGYENTQRFSQQQFTLSFMKLYKEVFEAQ
ncbi:glycosyltransferase family 1 protein [Robiginitalea sp. SC105]|uniref:glycosyltransferase family 4 protein n=1 Tax=Robiginitalea sp. SC105 TaxID=2762332 RepID=UPI00163B07D6|nr:glycosyltransferase family 1 protein [Robiginitalea sp. SC105]MBC2839276.1 glycosyltransferase family 4 protein [Robiginitalea sp. SC105]